MTLPISPKRASPLDHPSVWLAGRSFLLALVISQLTRAALSAMSVDAFGSSPAAWLAVGWRGLASDALMAALLALPLLAVGAITHGRRPLAPSRRAKRVIGLAVIAFALLFTATAEGLFWDEFSTRFNFISVDYLIYTREVVGNIRESYPIGSMLSALAVIAVLASGVMARVSPPSSAAPWGWRARLVVAAAALFCMLPAGRLAMRLHDGAETTASLRSHAALPELARNGAVAFVAALRDNSLAFNRFYATVAAEEVDALGGPWPRQRELPGMRRASLPAFAAGPAKVPGSGPLHATAPAGRRPRHVVLIQVESLSAEYLGVFGNEQGLTPNLDRIAREGLLFTQLYATGTRTVRGLEALSAGLPPLPGQSLVRRPDNAGLVTLGGVLREHGFTPEFLYGGYGVFDNMNAWFAGSGYRVRDRSDLARDPDRFSNVWGVADEYLFDEALATMDREASGPRRMLLHMMTTSNHRPYTYPEGRIDIPSKTGRDGAVKYTDWAIGNFLEQARTRPWFDDTMFVIVADHCASSAGRTSLPPDRYHIPAIVYWPGHLAAGTVNHLASQIDLVPTLLGRLGIDDGGVFPGQDLLGEHVEQRAFLGNYQEIGMLVPGADGGRDLVVLAPRRRVTQHHVDAGGAVRAAPVDESLARRTMAQFQQADSLLSSGRYRLDANPAPLRPGPVALLSGGMRPQTAGAAPARDAH